MPPLDPRTDVFSEHTSLQFRRARQASYIHRYGRAGGPLRWSETSLGNKVAALAALCAIGSVAALLMIPVLTGLSALFSHL